MHYTQSLKKRNNQHIFMHYTIFFSLFFVFTYGIFAAFGFSIISHFDPFQQHYPMLLEFRAWLLQILHNPFHPQMWAFNYGLGADKFQMFAYYDIGYPLNYLSVFIPVSFLPVFFQLLTIIRLYLSGIAFVFLARHFSLSNKSILVGSLIVFSSGFASYSVIEEPFFLNALIIIPFLVISINRLFDSGKSNFFAVMIFIALVSNFYLAYVMILGIVLYAITLYFFRYREKKLGTLLFKSFTSGLIGLSLSAAIILPVVFAMQSSPRVGQKLANGLLFYPLKQYLSLPVDLVSGGGIDSFWVVLPCIPLAIISVVWSLSHFKDRNFGIANSIYIVSVVGLLFPFFAAIFNGFSSPSNRWVFLLIPLMGINVACMLDQIVKEKKSNILFIMFGVIGLSLIDSLNIFILGENSGLVISFIFLSIYLLFLIIAWHDSKMLNGHVWLYITMFNAIFGMWMAQINGKDIQNRLPMSAEKINSAVNMPFNGAERYSFNNGRSAISSGYTVSDGLKPKNFFGMQQGVVSFFSSMQSESTFRFAGDMGDTATTPNMQDFYTDQKSRLLNYLGVSNIFSDDESKQVADGYYKKGTSFLETGRQTTVYGTEDYLPIAFFQTNVIKNAQFDRLTSTEKESGLSRQVAVNNTSGLHVSAPKTDIKDIHFDILDENNHKISRNRMLIKSSKDKYHLHFTDSALKFKNYELRLELNNIEYRHLSLKKQIAASVVDDSRLLDGHIGFSNSSLTCNSLWQTQQLIQKDWPNNGWTISAEANGRAASLTQPAQSDLSYFHTVNSASMNFGTFSGSVSNIALNFGDNLGVWKMNMRVVAVPMRTKAYLKSIRSDQNSGVSHYVQKNNSFTLSLKNKKTGIVQTTIPYVKGWHVTLDGKRVPIEKVNNAFLGVKVVSRGPHKIIFKYRTPGLSIGILVSSLTAVVSTIGLWIHKRRF